MSLDLSLDYLIIDDLETVTYYQKLADGGSYSAGTTILNVYREHIESIIPPDSQSRLQTQSENFHFWKANLGSITPKIGDYILDNQNKTWIFKEVLSLDKDSHNTFQRFRCFAKRGF